VDRRTWRLVTLAIGSAFPRVPISARQPRMFVRSSVSDLKVGVDPESTATPGRSPRHVLATLANPGGGWSAVVALAAVRLPG